MSEMSEEKHLARRERERAKCLLETAEERERHLQKQRGLQEMKKF